MTTTAEILTPQRSTGELADVIDLTKRATIPLYPAGPGQTQLITEGQAGNLKYIYNDESLQGLTKDQADGLHDDLIEYYLAQPEASRREQLQQTRSIDCFDAARKGFSDPEIGRGRKLSTGEVYTARFDMIRWLRINVGRTNLAYILEMNRGSYQGASAKQVEIDLSDTSARQEAGITDMTVEEQDTAQTIEIGSDELTYQQRRALRGQYREAVLENLSKDEADFILDAFCELFQCSQDRGKSTSITRQQRIARFKDFLGGMEDEDISDQHHFGAPYQDRLILWRWFARIDEQTKYDILLESKGQTPGGTVEVLPAAKAFTDRIPVGRQENLKQTVLIPLRAPNPATAAYDLLPTRWATNKTDWGEVTLHDTGPLERTSDSEIETFFGDQPDEELPWQSRALCSQADPDAFFPEKGGSTREAKRTCGRCDVRDECLSFAVDHDERFGIWGGLSERERRRLKRRAV